MKNCRSRRVAGRIGAAALSFSLLSAFTSCGKADQQQQRGATTVEKVGKVMVIGKANPKNEKFWSDVGKGTSDAAEELGYIVDYKCADNDEDVEKQKNYIKEAIDKKYDAIVIAPNSREDLKEDLQAAMDKKIHVITINSKVDAVDMSEISCSIGSSDGIAGQIAARAAAKQLKTDIGKISGVGKVAIIGHTSSTADERIGAFKSTFTGLVLNDIKNPSLAQQAAAAEAENNGSNEELIDPSAAAQAAAAEAKKKGEDPDKAAKEAAAAAAAKLEAAQAKAAEAAAKSKDKSKSEDDAEEEMTDAQLLEEINKSYYIETERCLDYMEAYHVATDLLHGGGNGIKVLYGTNTNTTLGICLAVEEQELQDDVIVVGFNSSDKLVAYMESGVLDAIVLQNPYLLGYCGVTYSKKLIDGETVASSLDTGVTLVTKDNMNLPYVQLLLYPERDINFRLEGKDGGQGGQGGSAPADAGNENATDNGGQK